jgi:hypothetical protein
MYKRGPSWGIGSGDGTAEQLAKARKRAAEECEKYRFACVCGCCITTNRLRVDCLKCGRVYLKGKYIGGGK